MTDVGEDDLAALEREFSLLLRRARASTAELSRTVHPELDGSAYALLSSIVRAQGPDGQGLRAQDVAEQFGVDKGAISRQVARLERLGLVERRPDPVDGRARVLVATAAGRERFEAANGLRRSRFRGRLADWSPDDVSRLAELLGRLNATFGPE
ncbi:MAG: MarR family transcriptional regulator [Frankiales bacterium]|nr:MarR family transcriptional regulator [Frankiales bacterium]